MTGQVMGYHVGSYEAEAALCERPQMVHEQLWGNPVTGEGGIVAPVRDRVIAEHQKPIGQRVPSEAAQGRPVSNCTRSQEKARESPARAESGLKSNLGEWRRERGEQSGHQRKRRQRSERKPRRPARRTPSLVKTARDLRTLAREEDVTGGAQRRATHQFARTDDIALVGDRRRVV